MAVKPEIVGFPQKNPCFDEAKGFPGQLRDFINERLTAAAEEIFWYFENTIRNYQDEVDRYRAMLESVCKQPEVKLHRIDIQRSSHNGENKANICISQDATAVVLKKQADGLISCPEIQDVGRMKSEDQQFQSQSFPVVFRSKDQEENEDGKVTMVKTEEYGHLLQGQMAVTEQSNIQFHCTELPPLDVFKEEHLSDHHLCMETSDYRLDQRGLESIKIEGDHQEVSISQEREQFLWKQKGRHNEESDDLNAEEGSDHQFLSAAAAAAESQGQTQTDGQTTDDNSASPTEGVSNSDPDTPPGKKPHLQKRMKVHAAEKPHSCETCGKCFPYRYCLKQHMRVHTGERPYSCEICNKSFGLKQTMKAHMLVHTGEKPHSCETCGKRFARAAHLISHQVAHTSKKTYSCETCGKCFSYKRTLGEHEKIHTRQESYSCEVCGRTFLLKRALNLHMKYHKAGEHSCEICGISYVHRYLLNKHMRVHRGKDRIPVNPK